MNRGNTVFKILKGMNHDRVLLVDNIMKLSGLARFPVCKIVDGCELNGYSFKIFNYNGQMIVKKKKMFDDTPIVRESILDYVGVMG